MEAPAQRQPSRCRGNRGQGDHRRIGAFARHPEAGGARPGVTHHGRQIEGFRNGAGRHRDGVGAGGLGIVALGGDDAAVEAVALHRLGDAVHHVDRLVGPRTRGTLGRQHDGVGPLVDGGGHVGDLGPRRHRLGHHRFEHLGRHDDGLSGLAGGARNPLLAAGHGFQGQLDTQIATRHHDAVGEFENAIEAHQCRGLLDLGHDAGPAADQLAGLGHVLGALHEGECYPVDADACRRLEIGAVLVGQRRDRDDGVGQVDALAVGNHAAENHLGVEAGGRGLDDLDPHAAVVEQQILTYACTGENFGMGKANTCLIARCWVGVEGETVARRQFGFLVAEGADADFRSLQVGENADGAIEPGFDGTDMTV